MAQQTLVRGKWQEVHFPKVHLEKLKDGLELAFDLVFEYPGSRKGDFGEWKLVDWVDAKIEQVVGKSGRERR